MELNNENNMENRSKHLNKIHILRHTSLFGIPRAGA